MEENYVPNPNESRVHRRSLSISLPAGAQQNTMFTPAAFHLRDLFWSERDALIGKIVDFEFLAGATKGRMGRIFRLREDIVPGTLGL